MDKPINLNIKPETAKGVFSNVMLVTHSDTEFILDFAQNFPGMPQGEIATRVIVTPEHAKRILQALGENIQKYESTHGKIGQNVRAAFRQSQRIEPAKRWNHSSA